MVSFDYYARGNPGDVRTPTRGGFALMGGGADVDEAFAWMIERSGGGDFLVLRGSGADGYNEYLDGLGELDSVETLVLKDREAASDPFVLEKVAGAEAIFLAGGDQWNYVGKWKDTPLQHALNLAAAQGVPIGGTSAGLAVLGEHVFTAERHSITSEEALADPHHRGVTLESEFLDFAPLRGVITDSHFSERDRMGRLVTFMARLEGARGIGVDESTALLVEPDGRSQLVGQGSTYLVKAEGAPEECEPGRPLTFRGLEGRRLDPGESFNLASWEGEGGERLRMSVEEGRLSVAEDPAVPEVGLPVQAHDR